MMRLFPVLVVALLTMAATAVRTVSRLWLRHWIEHQAGSAARLARSLGPVTRLVHAAGGASMLVVVGLGAFIGVAWRDRPLRLMEEALAAVVLLLVLGQVLPRAIGRRWAPQLVPLAVPVLHGLDAVVGPVHRAASWVARRLPRRERAGLDPDVRDGLEELLRDGTLSDFGATEEMAIISGVVQFGGKVVRDVMTGRDDIFMLRAGEDPAQAALDMAAAGYSRVPVYRDHPDEVLGMVHVFDVYRRRGESWPPLRPVSVAAPDQSAKELLFSMLRARRHLAIVQEQGQVVGLVTLEDLLEELVGDIRDEHDDRTD